MWLFGSLKKKGKEPSTPMKIAIGMGIAALAYVFLTVFSFTLPTKEVLGTMSAAEVSAILCHSLGYGRFVFYLDGCRIVYFPIGIYHSYLR